MQHCSSTARRRRVLRRVEEIPQSSCLQIQWGTPAKHVQNTRINFNQWSAQNVGGIDSRQKGHRRAQ
jgi:hypothetical protein